MSGFHSTVHVTRFNPYGFLIPFKNLSGGGGGSSSLLSGFTSGHKKLTFILGGRYYGNIGTSSPPCWWTKTRDLSLAPFVRPPAIVHCSIIICVSRDWLQITY